MWIRCLFFVFQLISQTDTSFTADSDFVNPIYAGEGEAAERYYAEGATLMTRTLARRDAVYEVGCCVCLGDLKGGESVTRLPCQHWYHAACIQPWWDRHQSCPQCQMKMRGAPLVPADPITDFSMYQADDEGDIAAVVRAMGVQAAVSRPPLLDTSRMFLEVRDPVIRAALRASVQSHAEESHYTGDFSAPSSGDPDADLAREIVVQEQLLARYRQNWQEEALPSEFMSSPDTAPWIREAFEVERRRAKRKARKSGCVLQ